MDDGYWSTGSGSLSLSAPGVKHYRLLCVKALAASFLLMDELPLQGPIGAAVVVVETIGEPGARFYPLRLHSLSSPQTV